MWKSILLRRLDKDISSAEMIIYRTSLWLKNFHRFKTTMKMRTMEQANVETVAATAFTMATLVYSEVPNGDEQLLVG